MASNLRLNDFRLEKTLSRRGRCETVVFLTARDETSRNEGLCARSAHVFVRMHLSDTVCTNKGDENAECDHHRERRSNDDHEF